MDHHNDNNNTECENLECKNLNIDHHIISIHDLSLSSTFSDQHKNAICDLMCCMFDECCSDEIEEYCCKIIKSDKNYNIEDIKKQTAQIESIIINTYNNLHYKEMDITKDNINEFFRENGTYIVSNELIKEKIELIRKFRSISESVEDYEDKLIHYHAKLIDLGSFSFKEMRKRNSRTKICFEDCMAEGMFSDSVNGAKKVSMDQVMTNLLNKYNDDYYFNGQILNEVIKSSKIFINDVKHLFNNDVINYYNNLNTSCFKIKDIFFDLKKSLVLYNVIHNFFKGNSKTIIRLNKRGISSSDISKMNFLKQDLSILIDNYKSLSMNKYTNKYDLQF